MKKIIKLFIKIIAVVAILVFALCIYAADYYRADGVDKYMKSKGDVTVSEISEGYLFDGPGEDNALIFYPGAKVEETAYAPLMRRLAENGVDCFLIKMPLRLAFLGFNKANGILRRYDYEHYYLSGHSLGGAMAAYNASKHLKAYSGLFLLGSYTANCLKDAPFPVIYIYGENDAVLSRKSLERGFTLSPGGYEEIVIEGGNHAQFGSYGKQRGDGEAAITAEEQQKETVDAILATING